MRDEQVHNFVGRLSAVENIPDDVQTIHGKPLDRVRQRGDKALRTVECDDGAEYFVIVFFLVEIGAVHIYEFVDDVSEIFGQRLPHLAARVFGCDGAAHFHQFMQAVDVPAA